MDNYMCQALQDNQCFFENSPDCKIVVGMTSDYCREQKNYSCVMRGISRDLCYY